MSNDEINRYIHEEIMGKCWHILRDGTNPCINCDQSLNYGLALYNEDYCSDESPRRLLEEPWRLTTIYAGWEALEEALAVELEKERVQPYAGPLSKFNFACASAEQKSRAMVEAHKGAKQ